jgi:hypothetical protein
MLGECADCSSLRRTMPIIAVHYRYFDRKTQHTGEGEAVIRIHQDNFDPDVAEHRSYLEHHLAQAVAKEYPQHQEKGLAIIIVNTSTLEELKIDPL